MGEETSLTKTCISIVYSFKRRSSEGLFFVPFYSLVPSYCSKSLGTNSFLRFIFSHGGRPGGERWGPSLTSLKRFSGGGGSVTITDSNRSPPNLIQTLAGAWDLVFNLRFSYLASLRCVCDTKRSESVLTMAGQTYTTASFWCSSVFSVPVQFWSVFPSTKRQRECSTSNFIFLTSRDTRGSSVFPYRLS